ncbi:MAG: hypothetical protein ACLFNB_00030 [Candidatus Woesearchaeota archaeon]
MLAACKTIAVSPGKGELSPSARPLPDHGMMRMTLQGDLRQANSLTSPEERMKQRAPAGASHYDAQ